MTEQLLINGIKSLQEKEAKLRETYPPNACAQERLNELLNPVLDQIRRACDALQKIRDQKSAARQQAENQRTKLRGATGKTGREGKSGPDGLRPDPTKCR